MQGNLHGQLSIKDGVQNHRQRRIQDIKELLNPGVEEIRGGPGRYKGVEEIGDAEHNVLPNRLIDLEGIAPQSFRSVTEQEVLQVPADTPQRELRMMYLMDLYACDVDTSRNTLHTKGRKAKQH